ncbi:HAD family hydrolase [Desulfitobacterium sp. Sab5]|uniref:HAD family hydrolase n=1 Tax=Desulfitobacterium nosdiversum TaxID=3375356 RepID=UPI003CE70EB6
MIKNIIFDLGNVLLNFKPLEYINRKIPEQSSGTQIYEEIFKSLEWLMLDRGLITEDDALDRICDRNREMNQQIREVMDNWYQMLTPIESVVEVLIELKQIGYKVYFLSNFHLLAFEDVTKRYDFFSVFDGGIVSFKEKLMKPEKDIYDKLIKTYEINPHESIFIDDTKENIEGAIKLGFKTIHFTTPLELRKQLSKLCIL